MPEKLIEVASETGMSSLAFTDKDGLYGGIPRFLKAAPQAGISPVVRAEVMMEGGGHLVLLAEGMVGYRSLSRLTTAHRRASEDQRKPLGLLDFLLKHAPGLICMTGAGPFGLIPRLILAEHQDKARGILDLLREHSSEPVDRSGGPDRRTWAKP